MSSRGSPYNNSTATGRGSESPRSPYSSGQQQLRQQYQLISPGMTTDPRALTQNTKDQLIHSLRTHKVNTITELRRIEKIFAYLDTAEVTEPMTSAWLFYVDSHNLLNELRGITRTYPFSSECLEEAKRLVLTDPNSQRSWNYCWLVLQKIASENLVMRHARILASRQSTWGNRSPRASDVERLINALVTEWTTALRQMLRHWERPPTTTGRLGTVGLAKDERPGRWADRQMQIAEIIDGLGFTERMND